MRTSVRCKKRMSFFCHSTLFAIVVVNLLLVTTDAVAAPDATPDSIILEKLASPKDENPSGTIINEHNFSEYESLLPDELGNVIKSGDISLTAFRSLRASGGVFDESWKVVSAERATVADPLEEVAREGFPRGWIYPDATRILENSALSTVQQGEALLWNAQAPVAARVSFGADFTLAENGGTQGFSLRGSVQRIVPRRFRAEDRTGQLFRERVRIDAPALLNGLAWLTFRFVNQQEDVVWAYSPAIKKTRQIMSTNRSDPFLGSPVAVDDIFGFSGKIQVLETIKVSTQQALAPFFSLDAQILKSDADCFISVPERKRRASAATLAIDGKEVATSSALSDMNFVPRELVRVELLQRDPYSIYGRQIIYLDRDAFAPFYKFVYDRAGALKKVVVTAHVLTGSADARTKTVVPTSSFIRDMSEKRSASLSYDRVRLCDQADASVTLAEFDPRGLTHADERATAKKPIAAAQPSTSPIVLKAPATDQDIP